MIMNCSRRSVAELQCAVLGYTDGHVPRHAKRYRDFSSEMSRLQTERTAAFSEFAGDVSGGSYPQPSHVLAVDDAEYAAFLSGLEA